MSGVGWGGILFEFGFIRYLEGAPIGIAEGKELIVNIRNET